MGAYHWILKYHDKHDDPACLERMPLHSFPLLMFSSMWRKPLLNNIIGLCLPHHLLFQRKMEWFFWLLSWQLEMCSSFPLLFSYLWAAHRDHISDLFLHALTVTACFSWEKKKSEIVHTDLFWWGRIMKKCHLQTGRICIILNLAPKLPNAWNASA